MIIKYPCRVCIWQSHSIRKKIKLTLQGMILYLDKTLYVPDPEGVRAFS